MSSTGSNLERIALIARSEMASIVAQEKATATETKRNLRSLSPLDAAIENLTAMNAWLGKAPSLVEFLHRHGVIGVHRPWDDILTLGLGWDERNLAYSHLGLTNIWDEGFGGIYTPLDQSTLTYYWESSDISQGRNVVKIVSSLPRAKVATRVLKGIK